MTVVDSNVSRREDHRLGRAFHCRIKITNKVKNVDTKPLICPISNQSPHLFILFIYLSPIVPTLRGSISLPLISVGERVGTVLILEAIRNTGLDMATIFHGRFMVNLKR